MHFWRKNNNKSNKMLPKGRSSVFEVVRTTGRDDLCRFPLRKPVEEVSTSDIIPGSSSKSILGGG